VGRSLRRAVGILASVGVVSTLVTVIKMLGSCSSAASSLSHAGDSGEAGDGLCRAWMRFLVAATARSVDDAVSISIESAEMSSIQTR
jgi:hypothetical protein